MKTGKAAPHHRAHLSKPQQFSSQAPKIQIKLKKETKK
jgi:hypothetical protein